MSNVEDLKELFSCPTCSEWLKRCKMCEIGHTICEKCASRTKICPFCRSRMTSCRNFIEEDLLADFASPAEPAADPEPLEVEDNIACPIITCRNMAKGYMSLVEHIRERHEFTIFKLQRNDHVSLYINRMYNGTTIMKRTIFYCRKLFMVVTKVKFETNECYTKVGIMNENVENFAFKVNDEAHSHAVVPYLHLKKSAAFLTCLPKGTGNTQLNVFLVRTEADR